ncbi:MAG TPA: GIY-YIG nuclease family protein [Caulobacteraceae bacterium]
MDKANRKAALEAYKEKKAQPGVFAVRCLASGGVWVGKSPNLTTAQNGLWFGLRMGGSPFRTLQAAWREHGEAAFAFEPVERLPADLEPLSHARVLKERLAHWREQLGAEAL